jgi:hypothetical protein
MRQKLVVKRMSHCDTLRHLIQIQKSIIFETPGAILGNLRIANCKFKVSHKHTTMRDHDHAHPLIITPLAIQ